MKSFIIKITIAMILLLPFTGCTRYWYCKCRTFDQCEKDYYDCVICVNEKSATKPLKRIEYANCMKQKGYKLVYESQLPKNTHREGPELYWDVNHGFAGCK